MRNPLHLNDAASDFPPSWYAATVNAPAPRPALKGDHRADVCVVGAGYTGLTAALDLARKGLRVIVLEAHKVGWGASGRNGGQVGSGYNKGQKWLETRLGLDAAKALWTLTEEAKDMLRENVAAFATDALYRPGVAHGEYRPGQMAHVREDVDHLRDTYGYNGIEVLERDAFREIVRSDWYHGGLVDHGAGHIHPLRYVLALGQQAEAAGAIIHETSEATALTHGATPTVHTAQGKVTADHVVLAGNGYLHNLEPKVEAMVMPMNSFIGATVPLGKAAQEVLSQDIAACDSSHVVNYFRLSEDGRLLFGGRANYRLRFPADIGGTLHRRMGKMFPQIADRPFEYQWGGTLGVSMSRLPSIRAVTKNVLSGSGYAGHGVALSGMAGRVMAEAVVGQAQRLDTFSSLPNRPYPLGTALHAPALWLAMAWFSMRDRLGL